LHGVKEDQFENQTPCEDWNVKQLMNHMIGSFTFFTSRAKGEEPSPRQEFYAQNFTDTVELLEKTAQEAVEAWKTPGVMDKKIQAPMGEVTGEFLTGITATELLIHGWDLARATGQKMEVDDALSERVLELAKQRMTPETRGRAFSPEKEAPANSSALDRLAAYLGREV
jgi:uncharacterized protein (TIGR03086 family)